MYCTTNLNKGDSGGMSLAMWIEDGTIMYEHNAKPRVGVVMRVGSLTARTYSSQDWWQTTLITEILEDSADRVVFKTQNSIYEWKII